MTTHDLVKVEEGDRLFYRGTFLGLPIYSKRSSEFVPNRGEETAVVGPEDARQDVWKEEERV